MSASAASKAQGVPFDKKAYQVIYPQYIDSSLAPSEGRRISQKNGVANPTFAEIADALKALGYTQVMFDGSKSLPSSQAQGRQNPAPRGCIRLQIKSPQDQHYIKKSEFDNATRQAIVSSIPNKNQLLQRVAEFIRNKGDERPKPPPTAEELATQIQGAVAAATGPIVKHKK